MRSDDESECLFFPLSTHQATFISGILWYDYRKFSDIQEMTDGMMNGITDRMTDWMTDRHRRYGSAAHLKTYWTKYVKEYALMKKMWS